MNLKKDEFADLFFLNNLFGSGSGSATAPSIAYPSTYYYLKQNQDITAIQPTLTGGTPQSCAVSPALPTGLSINSTTCSITGIPTQGTVLNTFTVTASNSWGSGTATVKVRVYFTVPKFGYVANSGVNNISAYTVNSSTGQTSPGASYASGSDTRDIDVDPTGRFIYSVGYTSQSVNMHTIDSTTGALSLETQYATGSNQPRTLTVHPTGKFLYTATNSGDIVGFAINSTDGTLSSPQMVSPGGGGRHIQVHPTGKFLFLVNGVSNNLFIYSINETSGALTQIGSALTISNDPRSMAIHPSGNFLYVANYNSADIYSYTIDQSTGVLTSIGTIALTGASPDFVVVEPRGLFLYAPQTTTPGIDVFTINQTTGALTYSITVNTASALSTLTPDPSGQFLYTLSNAGSNFDLYTINQSSGVLTPSTTSGTGTTPFAGIITGTN